MDKPEHRLRVSGEIKHVRAVCDFVVDVAEQAGLNEDAVFQCQLAVEEVFTNIVEHGYKYNGAEKSIEVICRVRDAGLQILILDDASPFNPLDLDPPDPQLALEDRGTGGWGAHFVKQYMDSVRYQLQQGRNCLVLEKKRTDTA
jgi:anti-sigma regulatory factor (Ser/Thr protein kinase)